MTRGVRRLSGPAPLTGAAQQGGKARQKLFGGERFVEIIVGANVEGVYFALQVGFGGEDQHRQSRKLRVATNALHQLIAVHAGHHLIDNEGIGSKGL